MTLDEKIEVIKKTPIFDSLKQTDYEQIAKVSTVEEYEKDSIIFRENAAPDAFYLIVDGNVEILKEGKGGKQEVLAVKRNYEVFGEMAVIDDLPRSATIKARTDIKLLKIEKEEFVELLKCFSHISFEMARSVCYTVRKTNTNYISDLEKRNKQLKYAYEKLKKTQNELIRAEKLSVIGQFASLIIHDIKNPMANIRAYSELIQINHPEDDKIKRSTDIIMNEVDRLTQMTSELLEFARGEINLNKTPVNLTPFIETLIDTTTEDLKSRNIDIIFDDKFDTLVLIDADKMKRVFINLISNARDAIISDGEIVIRLEEDDKWIKWFIQDNGKGMDQETIDKIFEPFYTRKKRGTGLGMAIVKGFIDSHKGDIKVTSELDRGTTFEILLPKA